MKHQLQLDNSVDIVNGRGRCLNYKIKDFDRLLEYMNL